jgi:hypothetical protein
VSYTDIYEENVFTDLTEDMVDKKLKKHLNNATMLGTDASNKSWPTQWYSDGVSQYPLDANEISSDIANVARKFILPGHVPDEPIISSNGDILTLGSCFAKVLREYMVKNKMSAYNVWIPSGLHNTYAIYDFLHWVYTGANTGEGFRYDRVDNGNIADWTPSIEHKSYQDAFTSANAVVLTIGLAETWRDKHSGKVFWRGIPNNMFDKERHEFHLSSVEENADNLEKTIRMINKHSKNKDMPIILTLSPIPLKGTFRDISCMTSDCVSKSTLRVAIDLVMRKKYKNVYYWPSFEIVKNLGCHLDTRVFGKDTNVTRHVNREVSSEIVSLFMEKFVK